MHEKKIIKNTEQNNNCVFIVLKAMYIRAETRRKKYFWCFSSKIKNLLFEGKNKIVLKIKF